MIPVILALAVGCCDQIEIGPSSSASKKLIENNTLSGPHAEYFSMLGKNKFLLDRISSCDSLTDSLKNEIRHEVKNYPYFVGFCEYSDTISDFDFFYATSDVNEFSIFFQLSNYEEGPIFIPFVKSMMYPSASSSKSSECGVTSSLLTHEDFTLYDPSEINCVEEEDDGLSTIEIAGIAVGSVVGAGLLGYLLYRCWNRRSQDGNLLQSVL